RPPRSTLFPYTTLSRSHGHIRYKTIYIVQPSRFNPCCCGDRRWHQSYFIKASHFLHWTYQTAIESAWTMKSSDRNLSIPGPGWVIGRIGRVRGGPLHFWAGREFNFLTFVTLVHFLLKYATHRSAEH